MRNENYNFEIAPGKSVSFGYTLTEFNHDQPNEFELCSKRTQMESGYEVNMLVSDSWDTGFKGEVVIKNTSKSEESEAFVDGVMLTSVLIDYDFNSNPNPAPEPVVKGSIDLSTDESEIPTDSGCKTVYFYARTELEVPSITLFDKDTSQGIGILVDDGNYSSSGDDIKGDGVYTCKAEINISKEKEYTFYAQYADIVSESVEISVFEGFTDQENGEMDEVDSVLADWLSSENFEKLSLKEKEEQGLLILNSLAQEGTEDYSYGLIRKDTIYYDSSVHGYFFTYSCGVLGNVMLEKCDDGCNGGEDSERISGMNAMETTMKTTMKSALSGSIKTTNSAQILYAFREDEREDEREDRYPYYEQYKKEWKSMGLNTKIDDTVTVSDFKNKLKGKAIIVFSMHGGLYSYENSKKRR